MIDKIQNLQDLWQLLASEVSEKSSRVQIRADHGTFLPVFLAKTFPDNSLAVVIGPFPKLLLPKAFKKPEVSGLRVELENLADNAGGSFNVVLELQDESASDIFLLFVARLCEVIEKTASRKLAIRETFLQLERWRKFFASIAAKELSTSEQVGLYGELYLLRMLCNQGLEPSDVIAAWTGTDGTNQDFEFTGCAIEAKATTQNNPSEIKISNIRQLDSTGLVHLYLFHLALDVRRGGEETLPDLVANVRELARVSSPARILHLEEKLLNAGYRDSDQEIYESRGYSHRFNNFYEVREAFPRLIEKDIPGGVLNVKYSINPDSCQGFMVSINNVKKELMNDRVV